MVETAIHQVAASRYENLMTGDCTMIRKAREHHIYI